MSAWNGATQERKAMERLCRYMDGHPEKRPALREFYRRLLGPHFDEVLRIMNDRQQS